MVWALSASVRARRPGYPGGGEGGVERRGRILCRLDGEMARRQPFDGTASSKTVRYIASTKVFSDPDPQSFSNDVW